MTAAEIAAYNRGVEDVLHLATRTAEAMESLLTLRPTRFCFAAEALRGLAEEGAALLRRPDGSNSADEPTPSPRSPRSDGAEIIVPAHPGEDGNFGLSDEEIMRPSRETIINWLNGKTPMLASHWSKIAARMLQKNATAIAAE